MGNFWPKSKDNEIKLLKEFKDENNHPIENLPNEIMVEIFSYLDRNEEMKVSLGNKRWFEVVNNDAPGGATTVVAPLAAEGHAT